MPILNICLHNIVEDDTSIQTIYDVTVAQLEHIITICESIANEKKLDGVVYYFDDGYDSFKTIVAKNDWGIQQKRLVPAIITDLIGAEGRLSRDDIIKLYEQGYKPVPHGVSHASLAAFDDNDTLQPTHAGGTYQNVFIGKTKSLSDQEVLFQLVESRKALLSFLPNLIINEFVLPYGIYNQSTSAVAKQAHYKKILTCDTGLDDGQFLAPRHLITQENISSLEADITNALTHFSLLFS
ncbi:MAG: hypothetical protein JWN12_532 [Candidatus Saccharibacteria bacterium]|nr:hypothetical protein [Candidatus Saccharibacteria bacterium]